MCPLISVFFGVTLKKPYIEGNLLQEHFWFTCRSFGAGQFIIARVLIV